MNELKKNKWACQWAKKNLIEEDRKKFFKKKKKKIPLNVTTH